MAYNPPTLVNTYTSVYNTNAAPKTVSVTTQAGDLVVVYALAENGTDAFTGLSGNSISFTQRQYLHVDGDWADAAIWTGTDSTGGTNWTLSLSRTNALHRWGLTCLVFRNTDGVGASAKTSGDNSGAASLGLTTTQDNSAIVVGNSDWYALNGSSRTWYTVNGITPTSGNGLETTYTFMSGVYTAYGAYYNDAGSTGSKTVGTATPINQRYAIVAVEIKGTTTGDGVAAASVSWLAGVNS